MIHSWWVPQLGGKVDAVPGYTTYTWFKAPAFAGRAVMYRGQCAQLCGRQHAFMTALVKVVTPAAVSRRGLASAERRSTPQTTWSRQLRAGS